MAALEASVVVGSSRALEYPLHFRVVPSVRRKGLRPPTRGTPKIWGGTQLECPGPLVDRRVAFNFPDIYELEGGPILSTLEVAEPIRIRTGDSGPSLAVGLVAHH